MNERFKELAVQSDLWRMLEEYSWEFGSCDPEKDCGRIEKFAELIVRECMVLCKSIDETDTRYRYDYRRGVLDCVDTIKEHFGVKE
jgi:hypothetical protein